MITRRKLALWVPLGFCLPSSAFAVAEPKVIGILNPYSPADVQVSLDRFDHEMLQLGYVKGTHYVTVQRMAEGRNERLRGLAEELVKLKVDVIFATPTNAVAEAQSATSTIPIVFVSVADPVGAGFAVSLAHPGRNLTGVSNVAGVAGGLSGKRLELLKQMVPGLARVAFLVTPKTPNYSTYMPLLQAKGEALGLATAIFEAPLPLDLEPVFKTVAATRAQALDVLGDPYLWRARSQVAALALRARLPTSFIFAEHVEAGGLMSYGADMQDWMRQGAVFVDKIFKGAKPGDLPIEQPSKIDLVINRKTASVLGLEIPQTLQLQAARVIE